MYNCQITGNPGGGISSGTGSITLVDSTDAENGLSYVYAGGGFGLQGTGTVVNSTITGNSIAAAGGGGISDTGTLSLLNSIVDDNNSNFGLSDIYAGHTVNLASDSLLGHL